MTVEGSDCRQLVIDWPTDGLEFPESRVDDVRFSRDASGAPHLAFRRLVEGSGTDPYFEVVVGAADGPISFALRHTGMPGEGCGAQPDSFNEEHFAISVRGDGTTAVTTDSQRDALIWGRLWDSPPKLAPVVKRRFGDVAVEWPGRVCGSNSVASGP